MSNMILRFSIVLEIGLSILITNSRTKEQLHFDPQDAFQFQSVKNGEMGRASVNGTTKSEELPPQNTLLANNSTLLEIKGLHITNHTGKTVFIAEFLENSA